MTAEWLYCLVVEYLFIWGVPFRASSQEKPDLEQKDL